MPYTIKKSRGEKPFLIVDKQTGKVVGRSQYRARAERSVGYRVEAEKKKRT